MSLSTARLLPSSFVRVTVIGKAFYDGLHTRGEENDRDTGFNQCGRRPVALPLRA